MNTIFIFAFFLASCVTIRGFEIQKLADLFDISTDDFKECMHDNDFNNDAFVKIPRLLRSMDVSSHEQTLVNNFGCFITCVFEKGQIIQDNKIKSDAVLGFLEKNSIPIGLETKERLNACIVEANKESEECETGLAFTKCIYNRLIRQD